MTSSARLLDRLNKQWGRLGAMQRLLAVGLTVALMLAVSVGVYLNGRPNWVVLVSQAAPKDAAAIVARLQELKVPYQPVGDGYTIQVPKEEQYTAKLALAQAGLPKGSSVGMELFDNPQFGSTDFDRKVNLLRAQQGELEKALMRMSDLEYANVKLAIPDRSVFIKDQQPVTASVLVQPRSGHLLTLDQVSGIVNFVAGAVQGLPVSNVKVVDQSGRLLSNGLNGQGLDDGLGLDPEQLKRQGDLQIRIEDRVQSLLEPIFGKGNVVTRVNLELNLEASRIENQTVGNSTPKITETTREATTGSRLGQTAAAAASGDPNGPPVYQGDSGAASGMSDQWKTKTTTDFAISQTKETKLIPPGSVKRLSVGISINQAAMGAETVAHIKDTVASSTGAETSSISVLAMPFRREPSLAQGLPEGAAPAQSTIHLQPSTLALGFGAAAIVLLAGFFMSRRRREDLQPIMAFEPALVGASMVQHGGPSTLDIALGRDQVPLRSVAASEMPPPPPPQPPVEDEPPADQAARLNLEAVIAAKPKRTMVIGGNPPDEELMATVDELISSSPRACAEPLRQWLKGGS